jgi:hypothetical protein
MYNIPLPSESDITSFVVRDDSNSTATITRNEVLGIDGGTAINTDFIATNSGESHTLEIKHSDVNHADNTLGNITLGSGGGFSAVTGVAVNSQGHVTEVNTRPFTLPASDNYSSWTAKDDDGSTYTITSGDILTFNNGNAGIDINFSADDVLDFTNTMHTNNTAIKDDSRNTLGVTRLYRRDGNSDYSVQTNWTGTYWQLEGYAADTYHAPVRVEKAEVADSVAYANVTGTPTIPTVHNGQIDGRTSGLGLSGSMDATANQSGNTTFTVTSNATTASTASTIPYRDASGDITARLFRSEYDSQATAGNINHIMVQHNTATDNYIRPASPATIRSVLNVEDGATADQLCFKTIPIYSPGPVHEGTATADSTADSFSMFSGTGISLSTGGDNVTITNTAPDTGTPAILSNGTLPSLNSGITGAEVRSLIGAGTSSSNTTYSAGGGLDLNGTVFSVESDLRGDVSYIGTTSYYMYPQGISKLSMGSGGGGFHWDHSMGPDIEIVGTGGTGNSRISINIEVSGSMQEEFRFGSDGVFHADGDIIAFSNTTASDAKLKDNIQKVEGALELVSQLDGVTFNWKKDGRASAGVIAQNMEKVIPSAVKEVETLGTDETHKVVDYNQLSALFIEAIKELKEENKLLRAEIESLKDIIS